MVAKQLEEMLEAEMKLLNDRVRHDLPLTEAEWAAWRQWMGLVPSSSSSGRRRKKKRRKRRLPRRVRIRRCGARVPLSLFVVWCAVFPSFVDRPEMLGIMAVMEPEGQYCAFSGCGMCKVGFTGYSAPLAVLLSLSAGPPLGLHHGQCGSPGGVVPVVCNNRCLGSRSPFFALLQLTNKVVYITVMTHRSCSLLWK